MRKIAYQVLCFSKIIVRQMSIFTTQTRSFLLWKPLLWKRCVYLGKIVGNCISRINCGPRSALEYHRNAISKIFPPLWTNNYLSEYLLFFDFQRNFSCLVSFQYFCKIIRIFSEFLQIWEFFNDTENRTRKSDS